MVGHGGVHLILFGWSKEAPFYWGATNVPRKLVMGQSIWSITPKRKKKQRKNHELTHELINMNHTKYTISHSWHLQAKMKKISWSLAITNHSDFQICVVLGWFSGVILCGTFPNWVISQSTSSQCISGTNKFFKALLFQICLYVYGKALGRADLLV
jgi:hypothetical protein